MKLILCAILVIFMSGGLHVALVTGASETTGKWRKSRNIPAPIAACSTAIVGNKMYVVGSIMGEKYSKRNVLLFNIKKKNWRVLKNNGLKGNGERMVAVHKGIVYLFGGSESRNLVQKMIANKKGKVRWTSKGLSPMPFTSIGGVISVYKGNVLLCGGLSDVPYSRVCWSYNIASNKWRKRSSMVYPSGYRACHGQYKNKLFVVAGYDDEGSSFRYTNSTMQVYDWTSDTWTLGTRIPEGRAYMTGTMHQGQLYCMGGEVLPERGQEIVKESPLVLSDQVDVYDTRKDKWGRKRDLPSPLWDSCAGSVGGKRVVVVGGSDGTQSLDSVFFLRDG